MRTGQNVEFRQTIHTLATELTLLKAKVQQEIEDQQGLQRTLNELESCMGLTQEMIPKMQSRTRFLDQLSEKRQKEVDDRRREMAFLKQACYAQNDRLRAQISQEAQRNPYSLQEEFNLIKGAPAENRHDLLCESFKNEALAEYNQAREALLEEMKILKFPCLAVSDDRVVGSLNQRHITFMDTVKTLIRLDAYKGHETQLSIDQVSLAVDRVARMQVPKKSAGQIVPKEEKDDHLEARVELARIRRLLSSNDGGMAAAGWLDQESDSQSELVTI